MVCRWLRTLPAAWWGLKICSSERDVPLVGVAIWAAERVVQANSESAFAFPRYNQSDVTAANSASAALNKLLKQYVLAGCTVHSFRHSMRDRLRTVECLSEMIDRIGVWATDGVGQSYGSGYLLKMLQKQIAKVIVNVG